MKVLASQTVQVNKYNVQKENTYKKRQKSILCEFNARINKTNIILLNLALDTCNGSINN